MDYVLEDLLYWCRCVRSWVDYWIGKNVRWLVWYVRADVTCFSVRMFSVVGVLFDREDCKLVGFMRAELSCSSGRDQLDLGWILGKSRL